LRGFMEHWALYLLMFLFGYMTHKTFYFMKASRLSVTLLKTSYIIYLSVLIKALEHLSYARELMLEHMIKAEKNSIQISSFEIRFDKDVQMFKSRSIAALIAIHPTFFRTIIEFDDWPSSMEYLLSKKEVALAFWESESDK